MTTDPYPEPQPEPQPDGYIADGDAGEPTEQQAQEGQPRGTSGKRFAWEPDFVEAPERTGPPRWVGVGVGFLVPALAAGVAFYVIDPWGMDSMTCKRLGKEAVKVSAFQDDGKRLVDVDDSRLISDDREDYTAPTGPQREVVMTCAATGWWSNNSTSDITVTLEVDAEENLLVFYVPTPGGESSRGV